ncbi:hypothetical protein V6Z11_D08G148100 [Gossypium hirsutum]|uniref:Uncharacterized protein n=1 Tax=Gossypium tomentosum TaxID=34277 RepID=A0A5D2JUH1_GOSTO|nr:hypothetical protein ES332_D08G157400v1 [Gossypium tomentosum]
MNLWTWSENVNKNVIEGIPFTISVITSSSCNLKSSSIPTLPFGSDESAINLMLYESFATISSCTVCPFPSIVGSDTSVVKSGRHLIFFVTLPTPQFEAVEFAPIAKSTRQSISNMFSLIVIKVNC